MPCQYSTPPGEKCGLGLVRIAIHRQRYRSVKKRGNGVSHASYAQVGLVTLVGLIAKKGILIVEFANKLQLNGINKLDAIHQASMIRLRPVLMTKAATIAGHFPLVLATDAGAAARNSIGLASISHQAA